MRVMNFALQREGRLEDHEADRLLLRRYVSQKDEGAFRTLVGRHLDFVYSVCRRELGSREAAQDVTQEVFVALARRAPNLRTDAGLRPWLFKVAVNKCLQLRRNEGR